MKSSSFVKNAFILTATSLILRTVGIFFRVYMAGQLGAEGMGLYQLVFSVYTLAATFASAGICTAVTRLVADELACGSAATVSKIMRRSVGLSMVIGLLSAVIIFVGADWIATLWLDDTRATLSLKVLCVSLPFMGASSCLRGYFIARRKVGTPSRAQLVEQVVRIVVIVWLMERLAPLGVAFGCMAILLGDAVAEIASCIYQTVGYVWDRRHQETGDTVSPPSPIFRRMINIALPITAGRYLHTALRTIENVLVPAKLTEFCLSRERALASFGALKGMAMPLIFFPASFLSALSTLLIPEISEANALRQKARVERAVNHTLHLTLTAAILLSGLFTLFAEELGQLFYQSAEVGFLLKVLAPLMPLMYVESVVDGILKGLNQQVSSLAYSVTDSGLRILLILLIVPYRGMEGFLFIMVLSNLFTAGLNIRRLLKVTGLPLQWGKWVLKPVTAIGLSGGVAWGLTRLPFFEGSPDWLIVGGGGVIAVIGYVLLLPLFGCIRRDDLRLKA